MKDFTARIKDDSPRRADWLKVFGTNIVELKSPVLREASLPGIPYALIYELDIKALSAEQRRRLVEHISERFNENPALVDDLLDQTGCPILADDVVVTVLYPIRWFS